ncbi:MAG: hypothetical protein ACRD44_03895, partial [Bryobacteraceae bacterium]
LSRRESEIRQHDFVTSGDPEAETSFQEARGACGDGIQNPPLLACQNAGLHRSLQGFRDILAD